MVMDTAQEFVAFLSSAAVGAFVSSVITVVAQWRERKSRREELLLTKAMEMARARVDTIAATTGGKIEPDILMTEDYYVSLKHLIEHNCLDPKTKDRIGAQLAKHGMKL